MPEALKASLPPDSTALYSEQQPNGNFSSQTILRLFDYTFHAFRTLLISLHCRTPLQELRHVW
jgi:hypothetical protein